MTTTALRAYFYVNQGRRLLFVPEGSRPPCFPFVQGELTAGGTPKYRARCLCGWWDRPRLTVDVASTDAVDHIRNESVSRNQSISLTGFTEPE